MARNICLLAFGGLDGRHFVDGMVAALSRFNHRREISPPDAWHQRIASCDCWSESDGLSIVGVTHLGLVRCDQPR
jgi:hypothetical protein